MVYCDFLHSTLTYFLYLDWGVIRGGGGGVGSRGWSHTSLCVHISLQGYIENELIEDGVK